MIINLIIIILSLNFNISQAQQQIPFGFFKKAVTTGNVWVSDGFCTAAGACIGYCPSAICSSGNPAGTACQTPGERCRGAQVGAFPPGACEYPYTNPRFEVFKCNGP